MSKLKHVFQTYIFTGKKLIINVKINRLRPEMKLSTVVDVFLITMGVNELNY